MLWQGCVVIITRCLELNKGQVYSSRCSDEAKEVLVFFYLLLFILILFLSWVLYFWKLGKFGKAGHSRIGLSCLPARPFTSAREVWTFASSDSRVFSCKCGCLGQWCGELLKVLAIVVNIHLKMLSDRVHQVISFTQPMNKEIKIKNLSPERHVGLWGY